jgi:hypothetical protein
MIDQIMKYHFLKHLLLKFLTGIIQAKLTGIIQSKITIIKIISRTCRTKNHYNIIYYPLIHWRNGGNQ